MHVQTFQRNTRRDRTTTRMGTLRMRADGGQIAACSALVSRVPSCCCGARGKFANFSLEIPCRCEACQLSTNVDVINCTVCVFTRDIHFDLPGDRYPTPTPVGVQCSYQFLAYWHRADEGV